MSLTFLCPKHQTRGFHACAVPEPCPTRSSSIASELRKQSQGPERFAPAFAVRAVTNAIDKFQNTYKNWGEQKGGTWRKYAHSMGQMALSRIHPDDEVLAQLPPATSSVEVYYPDNASIDETKSELKKLLSDRADQVRRRFQMNAYVAVPLTFPMMFTPLSNLPMYWFAWRAYEQRLGSKRAGNVLRTIEKNECAEAGVGGVEGSGDRVNNSSETLSNSSETTSSSRGLIAHTSSSSDITQWVDIHAKCARVDTSGSGAIDTKTPPPTPFVCCRVVAKPSSPPPTLMFVPCTVLNDVGDIVAGKSSHEEEETVSRLEGVTEIENITRLMKRYLRVLKV